MGDKCLTGLFKRVRFAARHQSGIGDAQPGETRLVQSNPSISITSGPGPSMLIEGLCI